MVLLVLLRGLPLDRARLAISSSKLWLVNGNSVDEYKKRITVRGKSRQTHTEDTGSELMLIKSSAHSICSYLSPSLSQSVMVLLFVVRPSDVIVAGQPREQNRIPLCAEGRPRTLPLSHTHSIYIYISPLFPLSQ